jgi:hypothetical protein
MLKVRGQTQIGSGLLTGALARGIRDVDVLRPRVDRKRFQVSKTIVFAPNFSTTSQANYVPDRIVCFRYNTPPE